MTRTTKTAEGWISREVALMVAAWERGEHVTARETIDRHPEIDSEAAIRLIYEETCLRREAGLKVDTAEVIAQHARWGDELQALFDCDRLIRSPGAAPEFPAVGEPLGPFLLLAELGRGASGRTYLATDPTLADRPDVVKVIPDDQDEHLALARLRHTHIVPLFSEHAFPAQALRGLCMPYLGGASLAQALEGLEKTPFSQRSGKLLVEVIDRNHRAAPAAPPAEGPFRRSLEGATYVQAISWIAACLADALHYAHARGLVHMDIKPSNVLITADGQPMLLDFHLARGPIQPRELVVDRLGGTPGWMAPEQFAALAAVSEGRAVPEAVDGRADIFALGLLLRDALGGPEGFFRSLSVSVGLADIVRKCLAPKPDDRYDDAATLAEDLRRELNNLPLRGVRNRSPRERLQKWRRRHPGALAWGITGFALLAAAAVVLTASATAYRQRVSGLSVALEDGRRFRASGKYTEALDVLRRGLERAGTFPALGPLRDQLHDEIQRTEQDRQAEELHKVADLVRFHYGIELPSPTDARPLARLCQTLWDRRERFLASAPSDATGATQGVKTDLLELAAVWADLRVRLAAPEDAAEAKRETLAVLKDAEASFGPSIALDARREQLTSSPGPSAGSAGLRAPRTAWEHYDLARYHLRNGRLAAAASEFQRTLDQRPNDFWSNFYLGLCAYRLGKFDDAVASFQASIALRPEAAICHYNRALAYEALDRTADAERGYTRAVELDPALVASRLNRGILSYKAGRFAEAAADFQAGLNGKPDRETRGRLHLNLALTQLKLHDRRSALANAEQAETLGCAEAAKLRDSLR